MAVADRNVRGAEPRKGLADVAIMLGLESWRWDWEVALTFSSPGACSCRWETMG